MLAGAHTGQDDQSRAQKTKRHKVRMFSRAVSHSISAKPLLTSIGRGGLVGAVARTVQSPSVPAAGKAKLLALVTSSRLCCPLIGAIDSAFPAVTLSEGAHSRVCCKNGFGVPEPICCDHGNAFRPLAFCRP